MEAVAAAQALYLGGRSVAETCDGPLCEAMVRAGELWPDDKQAVLVEHRATMTCVHVLSQLTLLLPAPALGAATALGGAPPGDPYLLSTMMAAAVLREAGCRDLDHGPDTPLDVLADAVDRERPTLVWLAVTSPLLSMRSCEEIARLAAQVAGLGGWLVIGGRLVSTYEGSIENVSVCHSMLDLSELVGSQRERPAD